MLFRSIKHYLDYLKQDIISYKKNFGIDILFDPHTIKNSEDQEKMNLGLEIIRNNLFNDRFSDISKITISLKNQNIEEGIIVVYHNGDILTIKEILEKESKSKTR